MFTSNIMVCIKVFYVNCNYKKKDKTEVNYHLERIKARLGSQGVLHQVLYIVQLPK